MFFTRGLIKYLTLIFIVFGGADAVNGQEPVKYIFLNTMPGNPFKTGKPKTITGKLFKEITGKIDAPENPKMRLGISIIFDYLAADIDSVEQSLKTLLKLSEEANVPVLLHLDGINWMNGRPDIWNWWDPKKPGYNPENKKNVEWTSWDESSAIKISWRNWGTQFRTSPAPNLSSPVVINAQMGALKKLVPHIVSWYEALPPDKKYLLGGVKLGHETSIGVNAYFYKNGNRYIEEMPNSNKLDPMESYNPEGGYSGGLTPIGYNAVKTAGIKNKGRITARDLELVVHKYLDTISQYVNSLGVPKDLLYTHQGGNFAPWEKHLSFAPASNQYSLPGWSFYSTNPNGAGDLGDVLDRRPDQGWAAAEWWWPGNNQLEWMYNIQTTLSYKGCRYLAIFNWQGGLEKYPDGIKAVREVVRNWK